MANLIADVTDKVRKIEFFEDEYEGAQYNYAVVHFTRKTGGNYTVRLKGLKNDSVVIVQDLCVTNEQAQKAKKIDITSDEDDDTDFLNS